LRHQTMDKVQKHNSFNTNTPSSESYRNHYSVPHSVCYRPVFTFCILFRTGLYPAHFSVCDRPVLIFNILFAAGRLQTPQMFPTGLYSASILLASGLYSASTFCLQQAYFQLLYSECENLAFSSLFC